MSDKAVETPTTAVRKSWGASKTTRLILVTALVVGLVTFVGFLASGASDWSDFRECRSWYRERRALATSDPSRFGSLTNGYETLETECGSAPFRYYGLAAALDGAVAFVTWFGLLFLGRSAYRYVQRGE